MSNTTPALDDKPGLDVDFYTAADGARLNALFEALANTFPGMVMPTRVPFSTSVPLTGSSCYMPKQQVTNPTDFTPKAGAVAGSNTKVKLVADGVHIPTFSGFTQNTNTVAGQGWTNAAGVIHGAYFWYDGTTYWYTLWAGVT